MNTFFTSDTHYNHSKIIDYCDRPFTSSEEMDEAMIEEWNKIIKPSDEVYHLGDFCMGYGKSISKVTERLNGTIHLIYGNHDIKRIDKAEDYGFASGRHYHQLPAKRFGHLVVLSHYPFQTWNVSHGGSFHLHGHSHGTLDNVVNGRTLRRLDVGVDTHDFIPWEWSEIEKYMLNIEVQKLEERK